MHDEEKRLNSDIIIIIDRYKDILPVYVIVSRLITLATMSALLTCKDDEVVNVLINESVKSAFNTREEATK